MSAKIRRNVNSLRLRCQISVGGSVFMGASEDSENCTKRPHECHAASIHPSFSLNAQFSRLIRHFLESKF